MIYPVAGSAVGPRTRGVVGAKGKSDWLSKWAVDRGRVTGLVPIGLAYPEAIRYGVKVC